MGLCASSETSDSKTGGNGKKPSTSSPSRSKLQQKTSSVVDEVEAVSAKANKENDEIRQKDNQKRASNASMPTSKNGISAPHEQGDLDHTSRTSSMASRTMQKMIHTQSSDGMKVHDLYEMEDGKILGTGVTGAVRVVKHSLHVLISSRLQSQYGQICFELE